MERTALIFFTICSISTALIHPQNTYHALPEYVSPVLNYDPHGVPSCATNSTKTWCIEDPEYPDYDIMGALQYHNYPVLALYADVADLNTELSVNRPKKLEHETYLCSSGTAYIKPLRAVNDKGKWRIIVNDVQVNYESYTQTVRIEECYTAGEICPKVPKCYSSKCLQKFMYHRFMIYDPLDPYFPFVVENFKLPTACACLLESYAINH